MEPEKLELNYIPDEPTTNIGFTQGNSIMPTGALQSINYAKGTSGWKIGANGDVEFGNGEFRGDIKASSLFFTKTALYTAFESIDAWTITGSAGGSTTSNFGNLVIVPGTGAGSYRQASIARDPTPGMNLNTTDIKFQTKANIVITPADGIAYLAVGYDVANDDTQGFGFKISKVSGTTSLYAFWDNGTTQYLSSAISGATPLTGVNIYRAELDVVSDIIKFYYNEVLVHTQSYTFPSADLFTIFTARCSHDSATQTTGIGMRYVSLVIND